VVEEYNKEYNLGKKSYSLGINQFADLGQVKFGYRIMWSSPRFFCRLRAFMDLLYPWEVEI
jgi:hypothetical protein